MLMQIHISNLITIQDIHIDVQNGTTVITGETGSGKSILIDAIELALGQRATTDIVRAGQDKADISLCFDIKKLPEVRAWLNQFDLDNENGECIIRRTISKEGRSRSFINGLPTTLQPLRELSELLINIHGQHENQALLRSDMQRVMLDRFAGHIHLNDQVSALAEEWQTLSKEIAELKKTTSDNEYRREFLTYQLHELENLNLTPNEFQELDLEQSQLANSDELLKNLNFALQVLAENEENSAFKLLNQTIQALETVQMVDPKISVWLESLKNAVIEISDTEDELRRYLETIDLDPNRLQYVENRLQILFDLARKHKIEPQDLFDYQNRIKEEINNLQSNQERLTELTKKLDSLEKHYHEVAHKLSQSRLKAAKKLADEVTETIHDLALPHGEFHVLFEMEDFSHPTKHGMEKVIFEIKTNAGQPLLPLASVASGGELSRICLAIHLATAGQHTIPILIFDEVDVGIGGSTSEKVGKLLRSLGESQQVLCITHAPQVAVHGHEHLFVEKFTENNVTFSKIKHLTPDEKVNELARMLGGVEITKTTLEHAREMLENIAAQFIPNPPLT